MKLFFLVFFFLSCSPEAVLTSPSIVNDFVKDSVKVENSETRSRRRSSSGRRFSRSSSSSNSGSNTKPEPTLNPETKALYDKLDIAVKEKNPLEINRILKEIREQIAKEEEGS